MKEVKVIAWCDACAHRIGERDGNVEPATTEVRITLDDTGALVLDLCDRDTKALITPLRELLAEHGAPDGAKPKPTKAKAPYAGARRGTKPQQPRALQCLWCDNDYAAGSGFRAHLREHHGFADVTAAYGNRCPVCGQEFVSLGAHVKRGHRIANVTQAFIDALADGDPYGVVAERRAAGENVTAT